jgi:hypothetical protein
MNYEALWLTLIGFVGISLAFLVLLLLTQRHERTRKCMEHEERMKALEMGQQLPDVALARTGLAASQARAAGTIGVLVPLSMAGAALGGMFLIFEQGYVAFQFPLLCTLWGICGVVSLVAVATSLGVIASIRARGPEGERGASLGQPQAVEPSFSSPEYAPRKLQEEPHP